MYTVFTIIKHKKREVYCTFFTLLQWIYSFLRKRCNLLADHSPTNPEKHSEQFLLIFRLDLMMIQIQCLFPVLLLADRTTCASCLVKWILQWMRSSQKKGNQGAASRFCDDSVVQNNLVEFTGLPFWCTAPGYADSTKRAFW